MGGGSRLGLLTCVLLITQVCEYPARAVSQSRRRLAKMCVGGLFFDVCVPLGRTFVRVGRLRLDIEGSVARVLARVVSRGKIISRQRCMGGIAHGIHVTGHLRVDMRR